MFLINDMLQIVIIFHEQHIRQALISSVMETSPDQARLSSKDHKTIVHNANSILFAFARLINLFEEHNFVLLLFIHHYKRKLSVKTKKILIRQKKPKVVRHLKSFCFDYLRF